MNTNVPTLCLVMDGEKICSYEVVPSTEDVADFVRWKTEFPDSKYAARTIPLALCALAPEMVEGLKAEQLWRDATGGESDKLRIAACDLRKSLLSRAEAATKAQ
jgi:hypothetical protein